MIKQAEWQLPRVEGKPPCPRVGHTMSYLPNTKALLVIGGRNDEVGKKEGSPFLNDLYIYQIENRNWVELKYSN